MNKENNSNSKDFQTAHSDNKLELQGPNKLDEMPFFKLIKILNTKQLVSIITFILTLIAACFSLGYKAKSFRCDKEILEMEQKYMTLAETNQQVARAVNIDPIEKSNQLELLKKVIDEGISYRDGRLENFNDTKWKIECNAILEYVDNKFGYKYQVIFEDLTKYSPSQVFLKHQSVKNGLVILETVYEILDE